MNFLKKFWSNHWVVLAERLHLLCGLGQSSVDCGLGDALALDLGALGHLVTVGIVLGRIQFELSGLTTIIIRGSLLFAS